jgi:DNA modification methylase
LNAASDLVEKIRPRQIWRLGPHLLMCGVSTKADDVAALMHGASADFLFTSPPYNVGVAYESHKDETVPWERYGAILQAALEAWHVHELVWIFAEGELENGIP